LGSSQIELKQRGATGVVTSNAAVLAKRGAELPEGLPE